MSFTWRSVGIGLIAYGVSFLVALIGRIDPVHLDPKSVCVLLLSAAIGLLTAVLAAKWIHLRNSERTTGIMVFAASWFAGVYTPVSTIWINAPFYTWAAAQTTKPRTDALLTRLVSGFEKTAWGYSLGVLTLIALWCLALKYFGRSERNDSGPSSARGWKLTWADVTFGVAAFLAGLFLPFGWKLPRPTGLTQWIGHGSAAFLLCFLFRSFRLQRADLGRKLAETATSLERRLLIDQFARTLGAWAGLAMTLMIAGAALTGAAQKELNATEQGLLPFAYAVLAMKPLFCASVLPALGVSLGGFVMVLSLPRSTRIPERIVASAKQAAIASLVCLILLTPLALSVGSGVVPPVALSVGTSADTPFPLHYFEAHGSSWLGQGDWQSLGWLDLFVIAVFVGWTTAYSVAQAVLGCSLIWVRNRIRGN